MWENDKRPNVWYDIIGINGVTTIERCMTILVVHLGFFCRRVLLDFVRRKYVGDLCIISDGNKIHMVDIPLKMDSVYHLWFPMSRFLYANISWERNNIHARCDMSQSFLGQFNPFGNQLTVHSYTFPTSK